jgi:protein-disulfide isomerase
MAKSNRRRDEERRAAAAAKVAEMRRAQLAADRRRRALTISAIVVVVIAVIVGIFVIVATHNSKTVAATSGGAGATKNYGFIVGRASSPVTLVAYEDFQCPHCEEFESQLGATVDKNITDGKLRVEYRPVSFLDEYSTRALNAAVCVNRAGGTAAFKKFHDTLYANQPPEGGSGLPNSRLITYANQSLGKSNASVASCINDETFKDWTVSATDAFSKATAHYPSGASTPTVLMNGQVVSAADLVQYQGNPTAFQAAIDKATNSS